ncbi:MAG: hypothetical protein H7Y38_15110 [Armatimonadetes bacterium]|nr:hypothetical protein [Armatimonadota bacterium]
MRFHNTSFVPLAATIAVAALTVCLAAPAAHAQQLILNGNQTYSAQDGTY